MLVACGVLARCVETADGPPPVTLIQIKAGGVGLNLQAFSRVYITSPDWNPCNEIQAMARAHRLGQTRRVVVKKLVLQTTLLDNNQDGDDTGAGTNPVVQSPALLVSPRVACRKFVLSPANGGQESRPW